MFTTPKNVVVKIYFKKIAHFFSKTGPIETKDNWENRRRVRFLKAQQ